MLSCSLLLEDSDGDEMRASCLPSNDTTSIFTNISPHLLQGAWEGLYAGPVNPPAQPAYIPTGGYEVGVAISELVASVYRAASEYILIEATKY